MWITFIDYLLLPFYLAIVYIIAVRFRDRHYPPGHSWRPYFLPGLTVKIGGALFIGLIYQYYYGYGDTRYYFIQSQALNSAFLDSPWKWLNLVLHIPEGFEGEYIMYTSQLFWYSTLNNFMVVIIAAVFGMLTFSTYLPTSVLFAVVSFTGIWALFRTFAKLYPHLTPQVALAMLFIPSTFIWGSGIFKDTICMFGMGWMVNGVFTLLIQRRLRRFDLIMLILGTWLIAIIKIYILLAFLPAIGLWLVFSYSHKIRNGLIRSGLKLALIPITLLGFYALSGVFAAELGGYSLERIEATATLTQEYIVQSSGEQGASYSIGEISFTPLGIIRTFPAAVNVSLYRPYIWEVRKPIQFLNAIETLLFLLLTLKILFKIGPVRAWKAIQEDPNIQFCLAFTIIFGFAVGLTSGNFGTLSRYRIPCLPLFALSLVLIYYRYTDPAKKLLSFR
ncbi:MAG: hypothetical protein EOP52_07195 [Sphingobacteriales bacterium]|nr:MAG: hypothetical protein EOP52_07195 [Sphingobacteriales bacterium]